MLKEYLLAIVVNLVACSLLVALYFRDKEKAKRALIIGLKSFASMLPIIIIVVGLIGIASGFIDEKSVSQYLGDQSGIWGFVVALLVGSAIQIPGIIAFPMASTLLHEGAAVATVVVFVTTVTMVSFFTLPLEIKFLGKKLGFLRAGISFLIAIVVAIIMGAIL